LVEIQAYQCSNIISYLLKLAWQLLWQMTAPIRYKFWSCDGNSLCMDHHSFVYIYFCVWELDLRLNNIILHQFSSIFIPYYLIDLNYHCHHYWTSESLLNLWECTQDSNITNKWVVHFVIVSNELYIKNEKYRLGFFSLSFLFYFISF